MEVLRSSIWTATSAAPDAGVSEWIHLDAIRALTHHTTAVLFALLVFAVVGYTTQSLMREGPIKRILLWVDEAMLLLLLLYFALGLAKELIHIL